MPPAARKPAAKKPEAEVVEPAAAPVEDAPEAPKPEPQPVVVDGTPDVVAVPSLRADGTPDQRPGFEVIDEAA